MTNDESGRADGSTHDADGPMKERGLVRIGVLPELAEDNPWPGLTAIGPVPTERKIRDHALVLQSMSVWHATRKAAGGWVLLVRDEDYASAARSIERYEAENRDWPPPRPRERVRHEASGFTVLAFTALVAFFFVTGPAALRSTFFEHGSSVSSLVVARAPWRAVTALTLHADAVHVVGNAISGTVFASAVSRRLGPGVGLFAILASGALGNWVNAVYHHVGSGGVHRSIGASTAVFGAIGILAATQVALERLPLRGARSWIDFAAPIVGGLTLLGTMGAAEHSDLYAHLYGLLAGFFVGGIAALVLRQKNDESYRVTVGEQVATAYVALGSGKPRAFVQIAFGLLTTLVVFGSWILAFRVR